MADIADLKSAGRFLPYGFESRHRHFLPGQNRRDRLFPLRTPLSQKMKSLLALATTFTLAALLSPVHAEMAAELKAYRESNRPKNPEASSEQTTPASSEPAPAAEATAGGA